MLRHLPLTVAFVLLGPLLALAAHPCDTRVGSVFRARASALPRLVIGFCFTPTSSAQVGFRLQMNSIETDLGWLTPVPLLGPNANGAWYYEVSTVALTAGVLTLTAYTAHETSAPSAPIVLQVRGRRS